MVGEMGGKYVVVPNEHICTKNGLSYDEKSPINFLRGVTNMTNAKYVPSSPVIITVISESLRKMYHLEANFVIKNAN